MGLLRIKAWRVLVFFYMVIILMAAGFWNISMGGQVRHPELLLKLIGTMCFFTGTLAIPLVSRILFPDPGSSDPAFLSTPDNRLMLFDARIIMTAGSAGLFVLPLIPTFIMLGPYLKDSFDPLAVTPLFLGVITAGWVHLLMETASRNDSGPASITSRLGIIVVFIMLHVGLVGLLSRLAFQVFSYVQILKLLVDINPFSQLYMLMEGETERRLLFSPLYAPRIDIRLAMLLVHIPVSFIALGIFRFRIRSMNR